MPHHRINYLSTSNLIYVISLSRRLKIFWISAGNFLSKSIAYKFRQFFLPVKSLCLSNVKQYGKLWKIVRVFCSLLKFTTLKEIRNTYTMAIRYYMIVRSIPNSNYLIPKKLVVESRKMVNLYSEMSIYCTGHIDFQPVFRWQYCQQGYFNFKLQLV